MSWHGNVAPVFLVSKLVVARCVTITPPTHQHLRPNHLRDAAVVWRQPPPRSRRCVTPVPSWGTIAAGRRAPQHAGHRHCCRQTRTTAACSAKAPLTVNAVATGKCHAPSTSPPRAGSARSRSPKLQPRHRQELGLRRRAAPGHTEALKEQDQQPKTQIRWDHARIRRGHKQIRTPDPRMPLPWLPPTRAQRGGEEGKKRVVVPRRRLPCDRLDLQRPLRRRRGGSRHWWGGGAGVWVPPVPLQGSDKFFVLIGRVWRNSLKLFWKLKFNLRKYASNEIALELFGSKGYLGYFTCNSNIHATSYQGWANKIAQLAPLGVVIFLGGLVANSSEIAHLFGFFWGYLS
jgi:hypothetical protein